jgi:glycosyltransferase involved in cell wall biosynthesis
VTVGRPRLAVIFPSREIGGAERYAQTIAVAAMARDWRVTVCFPAVAKTDDFRSELIAQGINTRRLQIGAPHADGALAAIAMAALEMIRTWRVLGRIGATRVLIVLPHPDQSPGSVLAAALLPARSVVVVQLVPIALRITSARCRLYSLAQRARQRWVAVSEDNASRLAGVLGWQAGAIERIYNGVDVARFEIADRAAVRRDVRAGLGLEPEAQVLLTVARLSPQKAFDVLLDAIPVVAAAHPQAVWVWAGEGEEHEVLSARIDAAGLGQRVLMLGTRSDVVPLLLAADLFLLPSRAEGMPFALLEAMAAGVPVISTSLDPMRELIDDGVHGTLVPVEDSRALAAAMMAGLTDPGRMQRQARAARVRVAERHSAATMTQQALATLTVRR